MLNYGFLTSRKQRAIYLYRSDKFYRATFAVLIIFLLTQIFAGFAGGALVLLGSKPLVAVFSPIHDNATTLPSHQHA